MSAQFISQQLTHKQRGLFFFLLLFVTVSPLNAFNPKQKVRIRADYLELKQDTETIIGRGNVRITQGDQWLKGDHIVYDIRNKKIVVYGQARFFNGESTLQGREIVYDSLTGQGSAKDVISVHEPWRFQSEELKQLDEKTTYASPRTTITTCDVQPVPHYRIEAKEILVYQDDRVVARQVWLYFGRVPVIFLPSFTHALRKRNYYLSAGFDDKYGAWGKAGYAYDINSDNHGLLLLDWWERRGLAKGIDHRFNLGKTGSGNFSYYCIKEKEVIFDKELDSYFNEIIPKRVNRTRFSSNYRMNLFSPLNELRLNIDLATDPKIEYELTEQSESLILNRTSSVIIERNAKNYNLEFYAEKIDNYHEIDKKYYLYKAQLPKISFATNRLPLFNLGRSRFYHQYQFHFLNQRSWAESRTNPYHEDKDYFEQFADASTTLSNTQKITRRNTLSTSLTVRENWQDHRSVRDTEDVFITKTLTEVRLRSRLGQFFTNDLSHEQRIRYTEVKNTVYEDYQGVEVEKLVEELTFREPWWKTRLSGDIYYDLRQNPGTKRRYWPTRLSDLTLELETHPLTRIELTSRLVYDPYGAPNDLYQRRSYNEKNMLLKQFEMTSDVWLGSYVNLEYKQKRHFLLTTSYPDWAAMEKSLVTNYANIAANLTIPLTQKWRLNSQFEYRNPEIRKRYDINDFRLFEEEFTLTRDLHCFELNFEYSSSPEPDTPRRNRTIGFEFHLKALPSGSNIATEFPPKLFLFQ